jgi:hypothetical protein
VMCQVQSDAPRDKTPCDVKYRRLLSIFEESGITSRRINSYHITTVMRYHMCACPDVSPYDLRGVDFCSFIQQLVHHSNMTLHNSVNQRRPSVLSKQCDVMSFDAMLCDDVVR